VIRKIIKHRGVDTQLNKAREELLELNDALMNYKASRSVYNIEHIQEEIADCYNMLEQLCVIFNFKASDIHKIREDKNEREIKRINEEAFGLEI